MKELKILNVYQINILQHLLFMFKVKSNIISRTFNQAFSLIDHIYPTRFSDTGFKICVLNLKLTRFVIVFRSQTMRNRFLMEIEKSYTSIVVFKNKIKVKILNISNKFILFKACVRYFLSNFYFFTKSLPLKNYEKCFLFHLKSSFRSRDIQIFVIFSLPLHTFQIQKGKWNWNNL